MPFLKLNDYVVKGIKYPGTDELVPQDRNIRNRY